MIPHSIIFTSQRIKSLALFVIQKVTQHSEDSSEILNPDNDTENKNNKEFYFKMPDNDIIKNKSILSKSSTSSSKENVQKAKKYKTAVTLKSPPVNLKTLIEDAKNKISELQMSKFPIDSYSFFDFIKESHNYKYVEIETVANSYSENTPEVIIMIQEYHLYYINL